MILFLLLISRILDSENLLYYLGKTDVLPPPLSKEEEEYLVVQSMDGDLFARDKLIEHNLRLVVFLSKKYENTGYDLEDLVSIGTIGLIKAIKTYSNLKNIKLATYASRCIDNEILMYLRKTKKVKLEVSLEENLSYDKEGNELKLEDIIGTECDLVTKNIENQEFKNLILDEINNLNNRDKKIISLRYGLEGNNALTQKEVANLLGISQSYISRIEKKVIKKIKNVVNC